MNPKHAAIDRSILPRVESLAETWECVRLIGSIPSFMHGKWSCLLGMKHVEGLSHDQVTKLTVLPNGHPLHQRYGCLFISTLARSDQSIGTIDSDLLEEQTQPRKSSGLSTTMVKGASTPISKNHSDSFSLHTRASFVSSSRHIGISYSSSNSAKK